MTVGYGSLVPAFVVCGIGMSLFFAPVANTVLSAVRPDQEAIASGTTNATRELGGVFGIAVLSAVFSSRGAYLDPSTFVAGARPAVAVGAVVVALGAVAMAFVPRRRSLRVVARTAGASDPVAA